MADCLLHRCRDVGNRSHRVRSLRQRNHSTVGYDDRNPSNRNPSRMRDEMRVRRWVLGYNGFSVGRLRRTSSSGRRQQYRVGSSTGSAAVTAQTGNEENGMSACAINSNPDEILSVVQCEPTTTMHARRIRILKACRQTSKFIRSGCVGAIKEMRPGIL